MIRLLTLLAAAVALPALQAQFADSFQASPGFDLSGAYSPAPHEENSLDPLLAEFTGVPVNDAARQWALAWDPSRLTVPEHQCQVHVASYIYGGPLALRIWEEKDPRTQTLVAIKNWISTYSQERTIWMDGRPHPPVEAPHTFMGFSTGQWVGQTLVVRTSHIKQGWMRRNGIPSSDESTLVEYFTRHGDVVTHTSLVTDPVYLTEPYIRTQVFRRVPQAGLNWLFPCEPVVEIANQPRGRVPHFLPGENAFLDEFGKRFGVPREVTLGGAETMYPDIRKKIPPVAGR
jgi:hypothetical protein